MTCQYTSPVRSCVSVRPHVSLFSCILEPDWRQSPQVACTLRPHSPNAGKALSEALCSSGCGPSPMCTWIRVKSGYTSKEAERMLPTIFKLSRLTLSCTTHSSFLAALRHSNFGDVFLEMLLGIAPPRHIRTKVNSRCHVRLVRRSYTCTPAIGPFRSS